MAASLPDRLPTAAPGLRAYGGVRCADVNGQIDRDEYDYQVTTALGETHSLDKNLPADSTWYTLWDSTTAATNSFLWGRVKGTGGTWYLELRNAASEVFMIQVGNQWEWPISGNSYSGVAVSAINRVRARVLSGATATKLEGFLTR